MIMTQEKHLIKAHEQFETLCDWIRNAGEERLRIDQVERGLFARLLMLGLTLLKAFVAGFGRGDVGRAIEQAGRTLSRSAEPHRRRYVSIFVELSIERFVYAKREKQKIEHVPLDARLGLPAGDFSYVLEDWQQRLCLQGSFDEGVESLDDWLGVKPSVRSAEAMNRQMARHAMDFRVSQKPPLPDEEGLLIVVSVMLDFVQRIEANLLMRNYTGFLGSSDSGRAGRG